MRFTDPDDFRLKVGSSQSEDVVEVKSVLTRMEVLTSFVEKESEVTVKGSVDGQNNLQVTCFYVDFKFFSFQLYYILM